MKALTEAYNPTCIALQELILGQRQSYNFRGFRSLRSPGRGGSGLLINEKIPYTEVNLTTTLQAVAATLFIGKQYTVCSIYLPPNLNIHEEELTDLISQLPEPFLLLGDFNARDTTWGDTLTNRKGSQIRKIIQEQSIGLLNTGEPTHFHVQTGTHSCIDLSIASAHALTDFCWTVLTPNAEEEYDSDHFPIVLTRSHQNTFFPGPKRFNFKKARWDEYWEMSALPEDLPTLPVDQRTEFLTNHILRTAKSTIPFVQTDLKTPRAPFWNAECEIAKREKNRLYRAWYRTRLPCDRIRYNRARAIEVKTINEAKRSSWQNFVSSINSTTPCAKVWNRVKKISGKHRPSPLPTIRGDNGRLITNPLEVSEVLGDNLASHSSGRYFTSEFRAAQQRLEQTTFEFDDDDTSYNAPFSITELEESLRKSKNTSPGPDEIHYDMIRHLHPTALEYLLALFNHIWQEGKLPNSWRLATVIPIKKQGKSGTDPNHYRPISLTSCLCKTFERMINTRLTWYLEMNDSIDRMQFGYRKRHSTTDPLLTLQQTITQAFTRKRMVLAVSFDLEKAYDTTWKWAITKRMHELGLRGRLPIILNDFLRDRVFRVRVANALSSEKQIQQGLPQGSILSCNLFRIAINGITDNIPADLHYSLYVDDLLIYYEGRNLNTMERKMQLTINRITRWAAEHGYKFSSSKTQAILFNRKGLRTTPSLSIYDQDIRFQNEIKFLGLVFDSRLTWSAHMKKLKTESQGPLALLKCLSHLAWGADRKTLGILYKSLLRSKLTYACEVFCASDSIANGLNVIQNTALRIISGAFKSSPIPSLQVDCSIMPIDLQVIKASGQHFARRQQDPDSPSTLLISQAFDSHPGWTYRKNILTVLGPSEEHPMVHPTPKQVIPPWQMAGAMVCDYWCCHKSEMPPAIIAALFREHMETHSNTVSVFTDGSKSEDFVGCAVTIPAMNLSDSRSLPTDTSIFTAETIAIVIAMELIDKLPPQNYTIFSDSKSVLATLKHFETKNPYTNKVRRWNHYFQNSTSCKVNFCWVPAHVGIQGNELADNLAKRATCLPQTDIMLPYSDYFPRIKKRVSNLWQERWNACLNNKLRAIRPTISKWESSHHKKRRYETILTRLRIGHCNMSHVHLMKREDQPRCCGIPLTVKHVLTTCQNYHRNRRLYFPELQYLNETDKLKHMLAENKTLNVEKLMNFLASCNLINKI